MKVVKKIVLHFLLLLALFGGAIAALSTAQESFPLILRGEQHRASVQSLANGGSGRDLIVLLDDGQTLVRAHVACTSRFCSNYAVGRDIEVRALPSEHTAIVGNAPSAIFRVLWLFLIESALATCVLAYYIWLIGKAIKRRNA